MSKAARFRHWTQRGLFVPTRITRNAATASFMNILFLDLTPTNIQNTLFRLSIKKWNILPNHVADSVELQKFQVGANEFLLH